MDTQAGPWINSSPSGSRGANAVQGKVTMPPNTTHQGQRTVRMSRPARRFSSWAIAFLLGSAFFFATVPALAKYASFVMDADSGRALHSTNADTRNYPASLTKMMTLYILFEHLESGKLRLTDGLKVSHRAARQPASKLGLKPGSHISVNTAIRALIVKSANDVASVVADNLGGGEKPFAKIMTRTAHRLGMTRTNFRNSSGLPHRAQLSTARDMATLARALMRDFPQFYDYFRLTKFTFGGRTYRTHNKLIKTYPGADGLKTGYISASGFNVAVSASRNGRRLIGVVFGGRSAKSRDRHMTKLLDNGFAKVTRRTATASPVPEAKPSLGPSASSRDAARATRGRPSQWGIQVGAFAARRPARQIADRAVSKLPDLLANGRVAVVPLRKSNGRTLYRARILGLDKATAYAACRKLERRRFDCMELRVKSGLQIAEAVY